eukprot:Em0028g34a
MHPRYKREYCHIGRSRPGPVTRSDTVIPSSEWSSLVVGKLSPWLQLDSENVTIRTNAEKAFSEEIAFAAHLALSAIQISMKGRHCINLARCLNEQLQGSSNQTFWIRLPIDCQPNCLDGVEEDKQVATDESWEWWNTLRTLCSHSRRLGVALELNASVPSKPVVDRWCGEPVKVIIVPTSLFVPNKRGYPVLLRAHQEIVQRFFKLNTQVMLTGACKNPNGLNSYQLYLNHLYESRAPPTPYERFSKGYEDYLQSPLQPLMDNLDSQTYETFEKDPVKYMLYEKAITEALKDHCGTKEDTRIVVMVLGAGRGPLVRAALKAAQTAEKNIKVYAVEKNPGALVTLYNLQVEEWGDSVTIVPGDMRLWNAPEKADILVSELLGSFGDNELSPECLDGAQMFLKPGGISIPTSYTSYLAPICCPKLYSEVGLYTYRDKEKGTPLASYETPYVVLLTNMNVLAEPQCCFTFVHPNNDVPINNQRYTCLQFGVKDSTLLHGFAGYFESLLYKDIMLSIHPKTHSEGMFSWFPIYFPIHSPVYVQRSTTIKTHFWRCSSASKVWYEWCLSSPDILPIHNSNGRSSWIGL